MKYKILNRPWGRECVFSQPEATGDLNGSILLPDGVTDPTALINAEVERIKAMPPPEPEKPSVLLELEPEKEMKKWQVIDYMKKNPQAKAGDYLQTQTWYDSAFAQTLVHKYATNAVARGFGTLLVDSLETCWSLLSAIANQLTLKQLKEIL